MLLAVLVKGHGALGRLVPRAANALQQGIVDDTGVSSLANERIDGLLGIPTLLRRHFRQVGSIVVVGMAMFVHGGEFDDNSMDPDGPVVHIVAFLIVDQQTDGNSEMLVHFFQTQARKAPIPKGTRQGVLGNGGGRQWLDRECTDTTAQGPLATGVLAFPGAKQGAVDLCAGEFGD